MTEAETERAAVVAYLKTLAQDRYYVGDDDGEFHLSEAADAIEAREHLERKP